MKYRIIIAFIAVLMGCSDAPTTVTDSQEEAEQEAASETPETSETPISSGFTAFGQAVMLPNAQDRVYSLFPGRVTEVRVLEGDDVHASEAVLTIAAPEFIGLQQSYLEAKSAAQLAEAEYDRVAGLLAQAAISQQSFDVARNKRDQAQAQLASSAASLTLCGVNPTALTPANLRSELSVQSRIGGKVTQLNVSRGDWVEPTTALLEVIDLSGTVVEAFLPIDQAAFVNVGDSCLISRPGGARIGAGTVVAGVPVSEGNRIKFRIRPNQQLVFNPGEPLVIGFGE